MSRIPTPATIEAAPATTHATLNGVKASLGVAPNLYRLTANSPAALEGFVALGGALGKGALDAKTRERIALAVANVNGCDYCNSAHSYISSKLLKQGDDEIAANRAGKSLDAKADAAVAFSAKVVAERGHISEADLAAVKAAGYTDAQLVEIVAHVALNTLTNYLNNVFDTDIDFPRIDVVRAA